MTSTGALLVCFVLGQAGGPTGGSFIPVPTSRATVTAETATPPASRFGQPTPAEPSAQQPTGGNAAVLPAPGSLTASQTSGASPSSTVGVSGGSATVNGQFTTTTLEDNTPPSAAESLIKQSFPNAADAGEQGAQISLLDVLSGVSDRTRRSAAVQTYWEASSLLADWQFAHDEHDLLEQLPAPRDATAQAILSAERSAARARLLEAEMAAKSAQHALVELVPTRTAAANENPPLPSNLPFVGKYNTHFTTIFANRIAPVGLRRIHETLPLRRELVEARAGAISTGVEALHRQIEAYQSGQATLADVVLQLDKLRAQRGAFLGAVRDYNLDIAEYVLGTAQPSDPPSRIVSMMIEWDGQPAAIPAGQSRSVLVAPAGATMALPTGPSVIIRNDPQPVENSF